MDLSEKYALVAGGAGSVGEGIVKTLLSYQATVFVPSRSEAKLKQLQDYCGGNGSGRLIPILGDIGNANGAVHIRTQMRRFTTKLDLLVASLGGWWQGLPFTEVDMNTWKRILNNNLTSHFLTAKYFIPLLTLNSGVYIHINGASSEDPPPKAIPVSMAAAAQKMMATALSDELAAEGKLVYELILGPVTTRSRLKTQKVSPDWYTAEQVGKYIAELYDNRPPQLIHRLLEKK